MQRIIFLFLMFLATFMCWTLYAMGFDDAGESHFSPRTVNSAGYEKPITGESVGPDQDLHERFVQGILKSRSVLNKNTGKRKPYWFECGKRVPEAEREKRANEWAESILRAIKMANEKYETDLNPWGVFATNHKEGGFDQCSLDRDSRYMGYYIRAVKKWKLSYSKKEVRRIIAVVSRTHKKWKFDAGPMQVRRPGKKTLSALDEILSLDPGIQFGVDEMARRAVDFGKRRKGETVPHPRPWRLWPTTNPKSARSSRYDKDIKGIARFLGARADEI